MVVEIPSLPKGFLEKLKSWLCPIKNENTKAGNKVNKVVIQGAHKISSRGLLYNNKQ